MQAKYNVGDTLWCQVVYTDYETVIIRECRVVGIRVNEHGHIHYMCNVEGHANSHEYSESSLWPDKDAAIHAAQKYCRSRIALLQRAMDDLEKQLS